MGSTTGAWAPPRFRWLEHLGIAVLATAIMPFTALAWPFALFTGSVLGQVWLAQRLGVARPPAPAPRCASPRSARAWSA
jgi:hypothetical protein